MLINGGSIGEKQFKPLSVLSAVSVRSVRQWLMILILVELCSLVQCLSSTVYFGANNRLTRPNLSIDAIQNYSNSNF